jgi:protein ImuA
MPAAPAPSPTVDLAELRQRLAKIERKGALGGPEPFPLGVEEIDAALGGGLARGALHEVFAARTADAPSASAFSIGLALRAAGKRPLIWVRQDFAGVETGALYAPGLAELGLDPTRLVLVRARDGPDVLRAGEEAARCSALGAVLIEPWGAPKALDLVATRRLSLAAEASGVSLVMIRAGADPAPSAAATRWSVRSSPSTPLEADAPGGPAFAVDLVRARAGPAGRTWRLEWDREQRSFRLAPPLHVGVAAPPAGGQDPEGAGEADGIVVAHERRESLSIG